MTASWWRDSWASPMRKLWLYSDQHGLFILAELVDQFWWEPDADKAKEIRLQGQRFGLSPIDRRRLQWDMKEPGLEDEKEEPEPQHQVAPEPVDPRLALRMVKS
jgi:hypothetical protein